MHIDFNNLPKISDSIHDNLKDDILDDLYNHCKKSKVRYVDGDFNPQAWSSLAGNPPAYDVDDSWRNNIIWLRPEKIWGENKFAIFNDINPDDINQGALGDCYFLSALSALSEYPELIKRLFVKDKINKYSIYAVWLNITGQWQKVILDDYIPCSKYNKNPAFSTTHENELWVILLEKAYAKVYGGYHQISGGDPVYALRDLTGCPFERIEDFSDLNNVWKKLVNYDNRGFMMTCYTQNTEVVEEKDSLGMVSGHAYTLIQVANVKDNYGREARIMQIRNPWGSFEWKGDWSDNSNLWTNYYRNKLKVEKKDDGLFWMSIEDFSKNFCGIGVGKIEPRNKFNSIYVNEKKSNKKFMVRFNIKPGNDVTISIDQKDTRMFPEHENYTYSYFRITIGKIVGDDFQFIDSILSPERNIFFEDISENGVFVALIEPFWKEKSHSLGVSTYSPKYSELELLDCSEDIYNKTEYLIFKNFCKTRKNQFQNNGSHNLSFGSKTAVLKKSKHLNYDYGINFLNYENSSHQTSIKMDIEIRNLQGFDINGRFGTSIKQELFINKNDNDVIILKMDPRKSEYCTSQKISHYELIDNDFRDNTSPTFFINNMCGSLPTYFNPEPKRKIRNNKYNKTNKKLPDNSNGNLLFSNYNENNAGVPQPPNPPKDTLEKKEHQEDNGCKIF